MGPSVAIAFAVDSATAFIAATYCTVAFELVVSSSLMALAARMLKARGLGLLRSVPAFSVFLNCLF